MATAPYGVRLLVGAAVTAIEETRKLPQTILMYPMTIASQLAHLVMKVQQDVADLVNRGDETLEGLFPPKDEQPEWATFDEDLTDEAPAPLATDGERLTEGRFALFTGGEPEIQTEDAAPPATNDHPRHRQEVGLRDADAGPAAGAAVLVAGRRPRGAAGLRGDDQEPRTVPDSAGQQDHPRVRQVTADERGQSADNPYPVRTVAMMVKDWIEKLGTVWIEGEVAQLSMRPNTSTAFITLRDPAADMSLSVTCPRDLVMNAPVKLSEGTRVIMLGRPNFFVGRGTFSLRVNQIRAVGVGELLARIDRLRKLLAAEGLFDPRLKRPIPFLPNTVGLITGRASAAEHDVVSVAKDRWPAVTFAIRNTAVQGTERRAAGRRGAARARHRRRRRRHRHRARRRQRGGPAAVLRRDAVPGDLGVHHAGGQRHRPRTRQPVVRPGRRPACGHPDRRRQAHRSRHRRRTGATGRSASAQRAGAAELGAPRGARPRQAEEPTGAGPAVGRADRAGRRDPPVPNRGRAGTSRGWWPPSPSGSAICRPG